MTGVPPSSTPIEVQIATLSMEVIHLGETIKTNFTQLVERMDFGDRQQAQVLEFLRDTLTASRNAQESQAAQIERNREEARSDVTGLRTAMLTEIEKTRLALQVEIDLARKQQVDKDSEQDKSLDNLNLWRANVMGKAIGFAIGMGAVSGGVTSAVIKLLGHQ